MTKTTKKSVVIQSSPELMKELEDVVKELRSKKIKAIIFNHKNTMFKERGFALYNVTLRSAVTLGKSRDSDFSIANDVVLNDSRLTVLKDVAYLDDLLTHQNVYAIIDDENNFKCVDSKFNRKLEFDKESEDLMNLYYNEFSEQNNLPKYLVREKVGQYKLCYSCNKLILDELDSASVHGDDYCYDCIIKNGKESYVDANRLKLMQLHKLEID